MNNITYVKETGIPFRIHLITGIETSNSRALNSGILLKYIDEWLLMYKRFESRGTLERQNSVGALAISQGWTALRKNFLTLSLSAALKKCSNFHLQNI